jgi:hypothetical protein
MSGLVNNLDTTSIVSQLMQVEANPQTLLRNKLVATNSDASGYRAVNLRFDSLRSAAAGLTGDAVWTAAKATSSNATVTASAGSSTWMCWRPSPSRNIRNGAPRSTAARRSSSSSGVRLPRVAGVSMRTLTLQPARSRLQVGVRRAG